MWASDGFADFSNNPYNSGGGSVSNAFANTQASTLNGIVLVFFITLVLAVIVLILNYRKRVTDLESAINRMRYESRAPGLNSNR